MVQLNLPLEEQKQLQGQAGQGGRAQRGVSSRVCLPGKLELAAAWCNGECSRRSQLACTSQARASCWCGLLGAHPSEQQRVPERQQTGALLGQHWLPQQVVPEGQHWPAGQQVPPEAQHWPLGQQVAPVAQQLVPPQHWPLGQHPVPHCDVPVSQLFTHVLVPGLLLQCWVLPGQQGGGRGGGAGPAGGGGLIGLVQRPWEWMHSARCWRPAEGAHWLLGVQAAGAQALRRVRPFQGGRRVCLLAQARAGRATLQPGAAPKHPHSEPTHCSSTRCT